MLEQLLTSVIWAFIGLTLMFLGYKIFDWITPFNLDKEIDDGNVAAGVAAAGIFIAVAWIVAAVIA